MEKGGRKNGERRKTPRTNNHPTTPQPTTDLNSQNLKADNVTCAPNLRFNCPDAEHKQTAQIHCPGRLMKQGLAK